MYTTTTSSHRSLNKGPKARSTTSGRRVTNSTRSSSTPLAALAQKFDKFKRRMSNSSKKSERSFRSKDEKGFKSMNSSKSRPTPEKYLSNRSSSQHSSQHDSNMDVDDTPTPSFDINESQSMYRGVSNSSSRDDHTTVTATSTQPSFSLDDGSTIVSEDTTSYSYHTFKAGKQQFTVDKRYSMTRTIGSGAYGVVISAKDFSGENNVAIKMVPRAFHDEIDAKRILREIKLLKHFRHENIINITDMMPPLARCVDDFNDVYIVTDLMETDLHRIIYSKQSLSIDHVQYFLYQILRALKYMHSANVIHRDLKPSNLLVNSNCDLKVCDFGLARGVSSSHDESLEEGNGGTMLLTEYVVTRWYRAPEIMLACHEYSKPSDVWSVGCIFAELLGRKPFFPGDDYIDQLTIISQKLGKISEKDLDFVTSDKAKRFMKRLPNKKPVPLSKQFPNSNAEGIDLLRKMLSVHPLKRINVKDALEHPFFASLHNPDDEPVAHANFDFSFEDEKLHRARLQELIWQEVGDFRPSCLPVPPRRDASKSFCRRLYHT